MKHFGDIVKSAKPVHGADAVLKAYNIDGDVRIKYYDQTDFERIARQFGIFEEWKVVHSLVLGHLSSLGLGTGRFYLIA